MVSLCFYIVLASTLGCIRNLFFLFPFKRILVTVNHVEMKEPVNPVLQEKDTAVSVLLDLRAHSVNSVSN